MMNKAMQSSEGMMEEEEGKLYILGLLFKIGHRKDIGPGWTAVQVLVSERGR